MVRQISVDPSSTSPSHQPVTNGQQSYECAQGSTRTMSLGGVHNSSKFHPDGSNSILRSGSGANDGVLNRLLLLVSAAESTATMYHAARSSSKGVPPNLSKSTLPTLENGSVAEDTTTSLSSSEHISKSECDPNDAINVESEQQSKRSDHTRKIKLMTEESDQLLSESEALMKEKEVLRVAHNDVDHDIVEVLKERDEMKLRIEQLESTLRDLIALQERTKDRDFKADYERLCAENELLNASIDGLIAAQVDNNNVTTKKLTIMKQILSRMPTLTSAFSCEIKPTNGSWNVSRNLSAPFYRGRSTSNSGPLVSFEINKEVVSSNLEHKSAEP